MNIISQNMLINRKGFTLVESVITLLIFTFLCAGLYSAATVGDQSWQANKIKLELQQEVRKGVEWMRYDLREAGDASIFDVPDDDNWYDQITFKVPAGVSGGTIVWSSGTIQYKLAGPDGNQLQKISDSGTTILANNISQLHFKRASASPHMIEIALTGQKNTTTGRTITTQLTYKIQIRN